MRLERRLGAEQRAAERTALVDDLLVRAVLTLALARARVLEPHLHDALLQAHVISDGFELLAAWVAVDLVLLVEVVELLGQYRRAHALVGVLLVFLFLQLPLQRERVVRLLLQRARRRRYLRIRWQ